MKIMKFVVPVCLLIMTTCFGLENSTATKLEQKLKHQTREKQYLIEDDPNEGPEQKRDERQSTPFQNNRNLDANGNSRIINIRLQPPPNILTAPKQVIKTEVLPKRIDTTPQRIPTKIPVVLKTVKVVPGPAHAIRMKVLESKLNQSISNANKENALCQNNVAPPTSVKDSIPYFTIEDKMSRRTETGSHPNKVDEENSNLESNRTLSRDGKETSGIVGKNPERKDSNNSLSEDDQITSNSDIKTTETKPIHFFVDEPEPLPPSFRRQQKFENTAPQSKEDTINKLKEIQIVKKGAIKPKKNDFRRKGNENDDENDPSIVRISNGTHLISIKKIQNSDNFKTERLLSRNGEELTVKTEERIVNQEPPKPKPVVDEPEKHTFTITEKFNTGKDKNVGLTGLVFKDNKSNKEEKDINDCITITNHNYEEIEEKTPILPPLTLQPTIPPTFNEGNQESWNYLQNPYYNPYYQNPYDQYRKNHGLAQNTPNVYGQTIVDPRNYGAIQISPNVYGQQNIDPTGSEITLPYYPNGPSPTDTNSSEYPYTPIANEPQPPEIASVPCPLGSEIRPENTLDRVWRTWKDIEVKIRKGQPSDTQELLDIDIRRDFDDKGDGNKVDVIGKVTNPYATSSMPINLNGALVYPYVNPGYRYMR